MELQETYGEGPHIQAYEMGQFVVDLKTYLGSIIIQAESNVHLWRPQNLADVNKSDINNLLAMNPELILLGTGQNQQFAEPELLSSLYQANIGIEMMTTAAACRTYNLLMAEGRQVVAALLVN